MTVRIVIADDHNVVREALRLFLTQEPEFEVVGEARNGREATEVALRTLPDVVLMDLAMPEMDGVEAIKAIKAAQPSIEIVALTSVLEDGSVTAAVRAGATGYLLKDADGAELRDAIRAAARGEVRLSPAAAAKLVAGLREPRPAEPLSARETDVLRLVAAGLANKEIARSLAISESTVKYHVASLMAKLDVQSRTQAALYAIKVGAGAKPQ